MTSVLKFFKRIAMGLEIVGLSVADIGLVVFSIALFKTMLTSVGIQVLGIFLAFLVSVLLAVAILVTLGSLMEDSNELVKLKEEGDVDNADLK